MLNLPLYPGIVSRAMSTKPQQTPGGSEKRTAHRLSKDGKWRSFSRVSHRLQYVSSGTYFARIKVHGKIIRESLETDVWSTAQLRLLDFLKANTGADHADEKQKITFEE